MVDFKSRVIYQGTGSRTNFGPIPFDVISQADIKLEINDVIIERDDATYPWAPDSLSNPTAVVITGSAPPLGAEVIVFRDTPRDNIYKTFTNEPLNAEDLNNSFKQILFIEQEGYDDYLEAEELFEGAGNAPLPGEGQEDDFFLVSEGGLWQIRSPAFVLDTLGLGIDSNATFGTIKSASVSATDVSSLSATIGNATISNVSGGLVIYDDGQDYTRIRNLSNNPFIIGTTQQGSIVFKPGNEEVFRIQPRVFDNAGLLHNYGDTLPNYLDQTTFGQNNKVSLALSGSGKVVAANTTKGWGTVSGTAAAGTIGLTPETYGVSAVTRTNTGQYRLVLDTDVFAKTDATRLIVNLNLYEIPAGAYTIGVNGRSGAAGRFDVYVFSDTLGTTAADADFQFQLF